MVGREEELMRDFWASVLAAENPPEPLTACAVSVIGARVAATITAPTSSAFTKDELDSLSNYTVFASTLKAINGRTELNEFFGDDGVMCRLALLYLGNCREDAESVVACVRRLGAGNVRAVMPRRCRETGFFAALTALMGELDAACGVPTERPRDAGGLALGPVEASRVVSIADLPERLRRLVVEEGNDMSDKSSFLARVWGGEELTASERAAIDEAFYVPPKSRPKHRMMPPLHCSRSPAEDDDPHLHYKLYSMGFALLKRPVSMTYPENKLFEFFPIRPSNFGSSLNWGDVEPTYVLNDGSKMINEWVYAVLLRYSMFGFTHMRGGWDCLRHQEHLYYGAVPVFSDLPISSPYTPGTVPHEELLEVLRSPMLSNIGFLSPDRRGILVAESALDMVAPEDKMVGNDEVVVLFGTRYAFVAKTPYIKPCRRDCNVNFRRPGRINLKPYRADHESDIASGLVPRGTPLTFRAPAVQRHYHAMARPLWNLFGARYSAGAIVHYLLESVGHTEVRRVLVIGTSHFSTDYMHEGVMMGFSELGIRTDFLVRAEADKRQGLSFVGVAGARGEGVAPRKEEDVGGTADTGALRKDLKDLSTDPREVGMPAVEADTLNRYRSLDAAFTSAGRYNPFVARRIHLNPREVNDGGQHGRMPAQIEVIQRRLAAQRGRFHDNGTVNEGWERARAAGGDADGATHGREDNEPYDLVVYSVLDVHSYDVDSDKMFLVKEVLAAMPRSRILFIDHNDKTHYLADQRAVPFSHYGTLFLREMTGECYTDKYANYMKWRHLTTQA